MDITPLVRSDAQIIQSYAGGQFKISGQVYEGAVIVDPVDVFMWEDAPVSMSALAETHFSSLLSRSHDIDVVLLGTGAEIAFMPVPLRQALKAGGLVIEVMDTGAACRTYNVLMAEGRRVVAVLLPI